MSALEPEATARRSAPPWRFVAVNAAFTAVAMGVAAWAWWPIYAHTALSTLAVWSIVLGTVLAIVALRRRWSAVSTAGATVLAFVGVGVPLAVPARAVFGVLPSAEGLIDLLAGVALGWKQLLTVPLPVGDYEALLVPALVVLLPGTVLTLSLAVHARASGFAVLVPAAVFGVGIALGPERGAVPVAASVVLLGVMLGWLAWLRWDRRRRAIRLLAPTAAHRSTLPGVRAVIAGALAIAVASAVAGVAVGPLAPANSRTVVRTVIEHPFDPRDHVSPLSGFRSFWRAPMVDAVLFEVRGLPDGAFVRLAALDTWDGVVYTVGTDAVSSASGAFTRVPGRLDPPAAAGERVTLRVSVLGYEGVWLPIAGDLVSVDFGDVAADEAGTPVYYNEVTRTAAVVDGVGSGDSYTVRAVIAQQPQRLELGALSPGSATVPFAPPPPEALLTRLESYVHGIDGPGARLAAALDGLAADGYVTHGVGADEPSSRAGHSADRLARLFTDPRMLGDAEQYAVAAALMARQLGFPARVVMGFVPQSHEVRGGDVTAWIEVHTADHGWVAIDPNPPVRDIPQEQPQETAEVVRPETVVPPPAIEPDDATRQESPESTQEDPPQSDAALRALLAVLRVVGWVLLVAAIMVAPFGVVIAAKLQRRRARRGARSPAERIVGGWREFEDALVDRGRAPAPAATRAETAALVGGMSALAVATVADRAVFAPEAPAAADADAVWHDVDALTASLDEGRTRWQRLRARVSLRSLGGATVAGMLRRPGG